MRISFTLTVAGRDLQLEGEGGGTELLAEGEGGRPPRRGVRARHSPVSGAGDAAASCASVERAGGGAWRLRLDSGVQKGGGGHHEVHDLGQAGASRVGVPEPAVRESVQHRRLGPVAARRKPELLQRRVQMEARGELVC